MQQQCHVRASEMNDMCYMASVVAGFKPTTLHPQSEQTRSRRVSSTKLYFKSNQRRKSVFNQIEI